MKIGIMGLPQAGKSTLFQILTLAAGVPRSSEGRAEAHIGVIKVPDTRLDWLVAMFQPKKAVSAIIQYQDMPPLSQGAGRVDAQILGQLRQMDALLEVVRFFEDPRVPHAMGELDPGRDIGLIEDELILADLEVVENRMERIELDYRKGNKEDKERESPSLILCRDQLGKGGLLRDLEFPGDTGSLLRGYGLLTAKPLILLLNLGETQWSRRKEIRLEHQGLLAHKRTALVELCAKLELEIAQLAEEDRDEFMREMGIGELGLSLLVRTSYQLLGLLSFFTYMNEEVRAWTLPAGSSALQAAGAVHTDLERGFIRAEVIGFSELKDAGSLASARKKGLLRLEGKEYVVQDGDVITIRFHI